MVSKETRDMLDEYARTSGMKKGRLIEEALVAHIKTLSELPAQYVVPREIVLTPRILDPDRRLAARAARAHG